MSSKTRIHKCFLPLSSIVKFVSQDLKFNTGKSRGQEENLQKGRIFYYINSPLILENCAILALQCLPHFKQFLSCSVPWQLQINYSQGQTESRESFRSKFEPHSKTFEMDERVSIDFDGLQLELFQLLEIVLGSGHGSRLCSCILFNCFLFICIELHLEQVQEYRTFAFHNGALTVNARNNFFF